MKRLLFILLAASVLLSTCVLASDTRVRTMGDNNMVLLDEANIHLFPSRVLDYPNLAIGEFGGDSFTRLGIHWKFGSENPWVLGTYFSTAAIGQPTGYYDATPFGYFAKGLDSTNERVDLYYGRPQMLGNHNFGFHFGYVRASYDYDEADSDADYKEKMYYYDFGFSVTEANGDYDAAFQIAFGGWTDEGPVGVAGARVVQSEPDGFIDVVGMFRRFKQINPEWTAILHTSTSISKRGVKDHGADVDTNWATKDDLIIRDSRFSFDVGLGANWTPATNVLVVGDFGVAFDNVKRSVTVTAVDSIAGLPRGGGAVDLTTSDLCVPYWSIGFDADVFKWMDIRMGATSQWISEKNERGTFIAISEVEKIKWAANQTYLGFGFHWGRLHVDTETDPDLFLRGFDFITGNGGGDDMNARISVVYELM